MSETAPGSTPIKIQVRHFLYELESWIAGKWQDALKSEGFGRFSVSKQGKPIQDVTDELESLLDYERLVSFYESSKEKKDNRERFVIDFVSPYYSMESLQQIIIDRRSIVPRIVKNVAMLYKEAAQRAIMQGEEEHPQNDVYQAHLQDAMIHVQAKRWHRIYTLCDAVAVRPAVREVDGRKRLQYDILAPNEFRVAFDANDNVHKFMHPAALYDETGGITEYVIVVWTNTELYYRTATGEKGTFADHPDGTNPYGQIPWVVISKDGSNVYTGGLSDLVESNLKINLLSMLEMEDSAFAAISIPFGVNITNKKDNSAKFSPRSLIMVETDGLTDGDKPSLELISGTPHSEMLRNSQQDEERLASQRQGMAAFMLSDSAQELSGKAMKISMSELIESRQDDALLFEAGERRIYEKTVVVVNHEQGVPQLPMDAEHSIDFAEQNYADDPVAEYDQDMQRVTDNLLSYADLYRKWINPDAEDEEEIMQRLAEIKRVNSRMKLPTRAGAADVNAQRRLPQQEPQ